MNEFWLRPLWLMKTQDTSCHLVIWIKHELQIEIIPWLVLYSNHTIFTNKMLIGKLYIHLNSLLIKFALVINNGFLLCFFLDIFSHKNWNYHFKNHQGSSADHFTGRSFLKTPTCDLDSILCLHYIHLEGSIHLNNLWLFDRSHRKFYGSLYYWCKRSVCM